MRIFLRIMLLGLFAVAGVAVAICVGFSSIVADGSPGPSVGHTAGPAAEAAHKQTPDREPTLPRIVAPERVAPWPPLPPTPTGGPLLVEPYPALAQQPDPAPGQPQLKQAYDLLRRQLTSPPTPTSSAIGEAVVAQPPAAPAGEAISQSPPPPAEGNIDGEGDGRFVINCPNIDIHEALGMLGEAGNLNILASSQVQGKVSATLTGVDIDSALDAILKSTGFTARREGKFIYVGTPEDFLQMEHLLDTIGTRVYRPNYVTAAELNTLITPLLTEKTGIASVTSPAQTGIEPDDTQAGGDSFGGGEALLVRDYEAVLAEIDQVVDEIDVRPMQVHIEAMILSVKLDDRNDFGVNFEILRDNDHVKLGWGTLPEAKEGLTDTVLNNAVDMATTAAVDGLTRVPLTGGLKFGFLDSNLGAFLEALETVGDTNVIATPRLMVLNKQRAKILIGEELGYISTTVTENASTQSVDFLNVGAQLRLRPFISSDGLIRMEVHPELSTGTVEVEAGFTLPKKETTQVTSNIMVRDGCTVVIGGLMRDELTTSTRQIPLLGSLPLVGVAFREKTETTVRREVIVLITPHIVYEPDTCCEGQKVACEFHRRQAVYASKMSPLIGKRSIGRRYFRYAQNAWAAGDRDRALRFIELSIHFDPLSRAAIDLRSDIWLGRPLGDHALSAAMPDGLMPSAAIDGRQIAPWLLHDLEHTGQPQPAPLHPLDPGRPGRRSDLVRPERF